MGALDAVVCLDIYEALFQRAEELGKSSELNLLLEDFLNTKSRDAMEETSKAKKSRRPASAKTATASVPPFPAPTTPYFETPTLPSNLQLVLDNMLQGLCKKLRMWGLTVSPLKTGRTTNSAWNTLAEWSSPGELLLKPLPSIFLLDIALLLAAMR